MDLSLSGSATIVFTLTTSLRGAVRNYEAKDDSVGSDHYEDPFDSDYVIRVHYVVVT